MPVYILQDSDTGYITCAKSDKILNRPELDRLEMHLSGASGLFPELTARERIAAGLDRYARETGIRLTRADAVPAAVIRF